MRLRGEFVKVGRDKYKNQIHYSMRDIYKDRDRRARKSAKLRRRYPQEYD